MHGKASRGQQLWVSRCWSSFQRHFEQSDASCLKAVIYLNHWAKRSRKNPILFILLWSYFSQHHVFPFTVYKAQGIKYASLILVLIIATKSKHLRMQQKVQYFTKERWVLLNLHLSGTSFIWLSADKRVKQGSSSPTWFHGNTLQPDLQYSGYSITGRRDQPQLSSVRWVKCWNKKCCKRASIAVWGRWELLFYNIKMPTGNNGKDTQKCLPVKTYCIQALYKQTSHLRVRVSD